MTGDVRVTLDQDIWWRTRDGVFHLVDDLDDQHRQNIAGWLLDHAAAMNLRTVRERMMFPPLGHGRYGAGEWDPEWAIPSGREILNAARKSQDAFLDRLIASPLYRRMVGGGR
jgi:hypothetical protein